MLIVPTIELDARIRQLAPDCGFPPISRSPYVMVPSLRWFDDVWNHQWFDYVAARDFKYIQGSGMCEQFSRAALTELNFDCLETVRTFDASRRDVHVAGREAFVMIPASVSLNGVTDGTHSTCLVALTENGADYSLHFWEPQNRERILAAQAIADGVELFFAQ